MKEKTVGFFTGYLYNGNKLKLLNITLPKFLF